jgi:hypothetical protein
MSLTDNGRGTTPPQAPPLVNLLNDAASKPQVPADDLTGQRQERARLAALDEQYVRRSYLRMVDPVIVRYRRLLREAA